MNLTEGIGYNINKSFKISIKKAAFIVLKTINAALQYILE